MIVGVVVPHAPLGNPPGPVKFVALLLFDVVMRIFVDGHTCLTSDHK